MNIQTLMAQAQRVQKEITKKKDAIESSTFEGKSEWVSVTMNGKKEILDLKITCDTPLEKDDLEALEDMLKIAINKATAEVDKRFDADMGAYGNLGSIF